MEMIKSPGQPIPAGHYSHAIRANGFVFVSGQLPARQDDGSLPQTAAAQTESALDNVSRVLASAGSAVQDVVSVTVYVTDIALWPEVDRVYAAFFGEHRPARAVVVSPQLHYGCLIEIQVIACTGLLDRD